MYKQHRIVLKIQLHQLTHIYLRNITVKFHPDQIWNDGALDFFDDCHPNKKKNKNKMSSDMRSVQGEEIKTGWQRVRPSIIYYAEAAMKNKKNNSSEKNKI